MGGEGGSVGYGVGGVAMDVEMSGLGMEEANVMVQHAKAVEVIV